jgi:hypothetical protein
VDGDLLEDDEFNELDPLPAPFNTLTRPADKGPRTQQHLQPDIQESSSCSQTPQRQSPAYSREGVRRLYPLTDSQTPAVQHPRQALLQRSTISDTNRPSSPSSFPNFLDQLRVEEDLDSPARTASHPLFPTPTRAAPSNTASPGTSASVDEVIITHLETGEQEVVNAVFPRDEHNNNSKSKKGKAASKKVLIDFTCF